MMMMMIMMMMMNAAAVPMLLVLLLLQLPLYHPSPEEQADLRLYPPPPRVCARPQRHYVLTRLLLLLLLLLPQLPLYHPSPEEQADPRLYAANVRDYMLRHSVAVMGAANLQPSAGLCVCVGGWWGGGTCVCAQREGG